MSFLDMASAVGPDGYIKLEDGLQRFQKHWDEFASFLDKGGGRTRRRLRQMSIKECMEMYTLCFNMCTQKEPRNHSSQVYDFYIEALDKHLETFVEPALHLPEGVHLLTGLEDRWRDYRLLTHYTWMWFMYLDRYHVPSHGLERLKLAGPEKIELIYAGPALIDRVLSSFAEVACDVGFNAGAFSLEQREALAGWKEIFGALGFPIYELVLAPHVERVKLARLVRGSPELLVVQSVLFSFLAPIKPPIFDKSESTGLRGERADFIPDDFPPHDADVDSDDDN